MGRPSKKKGSKQVNSIIKQAKKSMKTIYSKTKMASSFIIASESGNKIIVCPDSLNSTAFEECQDELVEYMQDFLRTKEDVQELKIPTIVVEVLKLAQQRESNNKLLKIFMFQMMYLKTCFSSATLKGFSIIISENNCKFCIDS